jgi:hypothetical protein
LIFFLYVWSQRPFDPSPPLLMVLILHKPTDQHQVVVNFDEFVVITFFDSFVYCNFMADILLQSRIQFIIREWYFASRRT